MTEDQNSPVSVAPLLRKAAHLVREIEALPGNAAPDKYEKRAKAIGELYKTANLMESYAANSLNADTEGLDYDTTYAATPEQEDALREELLRYYDRIHSRSGTDGESSDLSSKAQTPTNVLPNVGADGEERSTAPVD